MLGVQRHIEARIGQLLGEAKVGRPRGAGNLDRDQGLLDYHERHDFRLLARARAQG